MAHNAHLNIKVARKLYAIYQVILLSTSTKDNLYLFQYKTLLNFHPLAGP